MDIAKHKLSGQNILLKNISFDIWNIKNTPIHKFNGSSHEFAI